MNCTHNPRPGGSRRAFFGRMATAGVLAGGGLLRPTPARADEDDEGRPNPIPGGVAPFAPFGIFIHHTPPDPALPLVNISDPSNITDFKGFVGYTRIRGGGTGTDTTTGASMPLAFQADMGFNLGEFIGTDGKHHEATFGFV
jgi:hypothetical protein